MVRLLGVMLGLVVLVCGGSSVVSAQAALEDEPACLLDPNSEECICAQVMAVGFYPVGYEIAVVAGVEGTFPKDINGDGERPVFDDDRSVWAEWTPSLGVGVPTPVPCDPSVDSGPGACDLKWVDNPRYGQECSLEYVREDLNRLWRFAGALAAAVAAVSFCWAGVVYMQESASGGDVSRARNMIVRVLMGLIIVGCAVVIWEGVSGGVLIGQDSWTMQRGVFHQWGR